jgi:uncharacterized membrane protein YfcA
MEANFPISFLFVLMPVLAFLYASVGHGGASSYLVLLALYGFAPAEIRPTSLLLNIGVSAISFLLFRREGSFSKKLFLELIVFSVPASFVGSLFLFDAKIYQRALGILLVFPVLRMLNVFPVNNSIIIERKFWMAPALGLSIGLVSGLIGIGGGIILSPVLLILGWTNLKQTAAVSALFIFLNSIAGFVGSGVAGFTLPAYFEWMLPVTLLGGVAGGYIGANKFNVPAMKIALATVLSIASAKFIFQ